MNILLAHFQIQDYGGIVNYSEYLARGFKASGHDVNSIMLKNKGRTGYPKTKDRSLEPGWEYGDGLDLWMHQKSGWEGMFQLNYSTDLAIWQDTIAYGYDLIIYVVSVPTCTKATKGNNDWLELFKEQLCSQLVVVHDGNMQKLYPHILNICDYIDGVICVHDAAYNSCNVLPIPRAFIPNAHDINVDNIPVITDRDKSFISLQTFKRWKRVDDLIRAIPHMDFLTEKIICGGGIEYCYMTSKTKCKPEYHDKEGNRIWDNAVDNGMEFKGYIDTIERDVLLSRCSLLIDPSWSKKYSELGCHFNRVMVEAMCHGCIPVCTDLAMKDSRFFKPGINYIEIPYDSTPEEYANIIDMAMADYFKLQTIQDNNLKLLSVFDMRNVANSIIDLSENMIDYEVGTPTDIFRKAAEKRMKHFEDI